jgi:hypothetical protein
MRPQFGLRDKPECLAIDCLQSSAIHFCVIDNRERLPNSGGQIPAKFDVTASLREREEVEAGENPKKIFSRNRSQFCHQATA